MPQPVTTTLVNWTGRYGNHWVTRIITDDTPDFIEDIVESGGRVNSFTFEG